MQVNCVFCRIVRGETPSYKIFEDDKVLAVLDSYPLAVGHTLVIPKRHTARVEDLKTEDAEELFVTVKNLVGPITRSVGATAATIGINDGREAGQTIPHVHIHIIPRSAGDGGGTIHSIMSRRPRLSGIEMNEVAERVRSEVLKMKHDST